MFCEYKFKYYIYISKSYERIILQKFCKQVSSISISDVIFTALLQDRTFINLGHIRSSLIFVSKAGLLWVVLLANIRLGCKVKMMRKLALQHWGLYYKTFYGSNFCCIVISQTVCHYQSLPTWSSILELTRVEPLTVLNYNGWLPALPPKILLGWK